MTSYPSRTSMQSPIKVDARQPEKLQILLPQPLLLSSQQAGWKDITLGYHQQVDYEIPETQPQQHLVSIYTGDFQASVKVNGQWLTKSYTIGDVGIFPAHQVSPKVQFDRALGFIHLCLEPAIFTRVAFEFVEGEQYGSVKL